MLSNFDFVTESLTLIAGKSRRFSLAIWYRRCTPVVVSSVTPLISLPISEYQLGLRFLIAAKRYSSSSLFGLAMSDGSFCTRWPRWISSVASPPSSRIMFGPLPGPNSKILWVNSQYSSSDSPLYANTGMPAAAIAAAAWSWVEKMLQEAQRTSAPSAFSVSISTAVWIVMWSDPATRAPLSGWALAYSARIAISAGISDSAMVISLRPQSASERSATRKSVNFESAFISLRPPERQSARTVSDASAVEFS